MVSVFFDEAGLATDMTAETAGNCGHTLALVGIFFGVFLLFFLSSCYSTIYTVL